MSRDKKRYQITLTEENMERFQTILADLGLPKSMVSRLIDELLERELIPTFGKLAAAKKEGSPATITQFLGMMEEKMSTFEREFDELKKSTDQQD